jgi:hypothetical protein
MSRVPKNWPKDVQYLDAPVYHTSVPKEIVTQLRNSATISPQLPVVSASGTTWTQIRQIRTNAHPACGQLGLFAARKIPPNTMLLWYLGEVHMEPREGSDYDLSLMKTNGGVNIGIDAQYMGNEARCINDYRGVAERPNAVFREVKSDKGELRMSVWSGSKGVGKNDEILVSYGKGWWNARSQA